MGVGGGVESQRHSFVRMILAPGRNKILWRRFRLVAQQIKRCSSGFAGGGPVSAPTGKRALPGECVQQITRSQSDDSTNVDSGTPASSASGSSTEPRDAAYTLPIGILSRLVELSFEP